MLTSQIRFLFYPVWFFYLREFIASIYQCRVLLAGERFS